MQILLYDCTASYCRAAAGRAASHASIILQYPRISHCCSRIAHAGRQARVAATALLPVHAYRGMCVRCGCIQRAKHYLHVVVHVTDNIGKNRTCSR